jgi:drug/metabolite transporter (DMT)-like permease
LSKPPSDCLTRRDCTRGAARRVTRAISRAGSFGAGSVRGDLVSADYRDARGLRRAGTDRIDGRIGFTLVGLILTLGAALSWAIGNVLVKQTAPGVPMLPLALVSPMNGLPFSRVSKSVTFFVNHLLILWQACNTAKTLRF